MNNGYSFRERVFAEDMENVRAILKSTGVFSAAELDVAESLVRERLEQGAASGYYFLFAENSQVPHGFACYGPDACSCGAWHLYWVAVSRNEQGQGAGREIVQKVAEAAASLGGSALYAETSSRDIYRPTRIFYERNGFRKEAVLEDFYAPEDDKVIYRRSLRQKRA